jgi:hypothetical protein
MADATGETKEPLRVAFDRRKGRLAGYEDVNDAARLARDPAMRAIVGREGSAWNEHFGCTCYHPLF